MRALPLSVLLVLGLAGCTDYDFNKGNDVYADDSGGANGGDPDDPDRPDNTGDDTGDPSGGDPDDPGSGDPGDDTGDGDPYDPSEPPEDLPPEVMKEDCDSSTSVSISPTIYVTTSAPSATTTITAGAAGWYHLYDYTIAESGSSQRNETAYVQITNATNPDGYPAVGNCGDDWFVEDADNDAALPAGSRIYLGTFWLDAGDNTLTLNHFCPVYMTGNCTWFHDTVDSSSTCESGGINSVHLEGEGLCVTLAE